MMKNDGREMLSPAFSGIQVNSKAKSEEAKNEDAYAFNHTCLAVADGVTSKVATPGGYPPGAGVEAARLAVNFALTSDLNGIELVSRINSEIRSLRGFDGSTTVETACTFACARICGNAIAITQVGDVGVRVNGGEFLYLNHMIVDELTSAARAHYIELTGDVNGSRDFILPLLKAQAAYRNKADHPLGYGVIAGEETPGHFVRTILLDTAQVEAVEIFTDGYPALPAVASIDAWEQQYELAIGLDPDRCKEYRATKLKDDRTVLLAKLQKPL